MRWAVLTVYDGFKFKLLWDFSITKFLVSRILRTSREMRTIAFLREGGVTNLASSGCPVFGAVGSEGHLMSVSKLTCASDYVDGDLASLGAGCRRLSLHGGASGYCFQLLVLSHSRNLLMWSLSWVLYLLDYLCWTMTKLLVELVRQEVCLIHFDRIVILGSGLLLLRRVSAFARPSLILV